MLERAYTLSCEGESLLAIHHAPEPDADKGIGVVIVVGGAQYRVGSHRMFVTLARNLAKQGCHVLRFDRRGIGDSSGEDPGFDDCNEDIKAAVDCLRQSAPSLEKVYLIGLCDGATAASICPFNIEQISGYILINPWVRSAQTEARVLVGHYYRNRFSDLQFWRDLIKGKVNFRQSLKEYIHHYRNAMSPGLKLPSLQTEVFYRLSRQQKPVMFVLSEQDITGQEFLSLAQIEPWRSWLATDLAQVHSFPEADHTFSTPESLQQLTDCCSRWLLKSKVV